MDFFERMTHVVDYIESHLADAMNPQEIAHIACCSPYQFGRIFAFATGMTLSEYVRRRRLSQAGLSLTRGAKVIDVALDAGYASPEAFARAFREMHGLAPREASRSGAVLRMTPRLSFRITIQGGTDMQYKLMKRGPIRGVGIVRTIGRFTPDSIAENWPDQMGAVWRIWEEYLNDGANTALRNAYCAPLWQFGVTETDADGTMTLMIGAEDDGGAYPGLTHFAIPAATWAVFTTKGSLTDKQHPADALLSRIIGEWLPASGYRQSAERMIEVYGPGDPASEEYETELWIPVSPAE